MIHHRDRLSHLLQPMTYEEREAFYRKHWDTWRWRLLFRAFFSQFTLGQLGTDPSFLRYSQRDLAAQLLARSQPLAQSQSSLRPSD